MAPRALQYTVLDFEGILAELTTDAAGEPSLAGLDLSEGSPDRRWFVAVATVGAKLTYHPGRAEHDGRDHPPPARDGGVAGRGSQRVSIRATTRFHAASESARASP